RSARLGPQCEPLPPRRELGVGPGMRALFVLAGAELGQARYAACWIVRHKLATDRPVVHPLDLIDALLGLARPAFARPLLLQVLNVAALQRVEAADAAP